MSAQIVTLKDSEQNTLYPQTKTGAILDNDGKSLGSVLGYQYMGVAKLTPSQTDPGTPDSKVFYVATEPGTYTNFGSLVVNDGETAILKFDTTWHKEVTGAATVAKLTELGQKAMLKKDWVKISGSFLIDGTGKILRGLPVHIGAGDIVTVSLSGLGTIFSSWRLYNEDTDELIAGITQSEEYTFVAETDINEITIGLGSTALIAPGTSSYSVSVAGWENKILSLDKYIYDVFFSKNILFGRDISVYHNAYYHTSHNDNDVYSYFIIPVINGETIYINPRARYISKNGEILVDGFTGGAYTPDFTGNLYVTFYNSDTNWIVTKESSFSGIIGYNFFSNFVIDTELNGESTNPVSNKAVYDSLLHKSEYQYGYGAINLLENAERVDGAYYGTTPAINANYLYFKLRLEADVEYYLSWGLRYISKAGEIIQNINPANEAFITFKPTETTDYYITFRYAYPTYFVGKKDDYHIDNVLFGKKWVACGDSFTHGDFSGATGATQFSNVPYKNEYIVYPFIIGRKCGMHIVNEAINGSTMAYIDGSRNEFSTPNGRYTQIPVDADYITLWFGINDNHQSVPIGTISDNVNTTFYGAWNIVMQYLLEHHPKAKIGIVITNGCTDVNYPVAIRNIAKKWGVSYLDINGDYKIPLMLRTSEKTDIDASVLTDVKEKQSVNYPTNQHPSVDAHIYQSSFIESWLKSL